MPQTNVFVVAQINNLVALLITNATDKRVCCGTNKFPYVCGNLPTPPAPNPCHHWAVTFGAKLWLRGVVDGQTHMMIRQLDSSLSEHK